MKVEKDSILIVDDLPDNLKLLTILLSREGYNVLPAQSGERALAMIAEAKPDLILLDIMMPDIDGYEVCRRLKEQEGTKDIPIIFLSALEEVKDKVMALKIGGVDYISKPFQIEEVLARVHTHLDLKRTRQILEDQNAQLKKEVEERNRVEAALERVNEELHRLSLVDELTQLPNRRHLDGYLNTQWHRLARERKPLALILCDVDYFKLFNDTYGHQAGDDCLKNLADALQGCLKRPADLVARYGGEEFLLILPDTDVKGALNVSQAITSAVEACAIAHPRSAGEERITLSMGIAATVPQPAAVAEKLVAAADKALYKAKMSGRNRVVVSD